MTDLIVLLKYKPKITQGHIDALASDGAQVQRVHKNFNWMTVKITADMLEKLKANPDIELVETDQTATIQGFYVDTKSNLHAVGQTTPYGISKIRAPDVWPDGNMGSGISWCVIDTGVNRTHPDLAGNIRGGHNYVSNNEDFEDDHGHGTLVCGIIAALNNDMGVVGVAPEVNLFIYKVLDNNGSGSYSNIVSAIDDAITNKMHGINMSLGGTAFSQALKDACAAAYAAGIVLVAAAGNNGGDGSQDTVLYPAKFFGSVIAVAATDENDVRAPFSSIGFEVEVSAPGVSIISTASTANVPLGDPSGYKAGSGTSFSTPHVSGAAILIRKAHPEFTPADVRIALDNTAVHLGNPGRNDFYGEGRIDAKAAVDHIPQPAPVLTMISITPQNASLVMGKTQQFKATALDQDNNPMPSVTITWGVISATVGSIDPTSTVTGPDGTAVATFTAAHTGKAFVIASSGNVSGNATVTVTEIPPSGTMFRVQPMGIPGHMFGVTIYKDPFRGDKTVEEACKQVCDILKTI